ncbi:MAG: hypothetical protein OEN55_11755, partial [Alphaproteobacteria bacterium]|nr:hypothetical protein [Alphaproteobacteria bacterium]
MLRRLMISVALVAGLIAIAALGLIAFRVALAEALLSSQLASLGIPGVRLTVAALDLRHMVVTDIALGDDAELRVDAVTLTYRPGALLAGRLEDVAIDGARLQLDLTGAGPPLGSLQALVQGGDGGGGGAGAMPAEIILSRGRIEAVAPDGEMAAGVTGRWRPMDGTATLIVADFTLPHVVLETARLEVEATPDRITVMAVARGTGEALDLDLRATIESWRGDPTLALAMEGSLTPAAWRIPPLPAVGDGAMALSFRLDGRLPPMQQASLNTAALEWFPGADLRGRLQASLADIGWRGRAQGITGTLDLALTVADGGLDVELADEGRIRIARLDPAWLDAIGGAALAPQLRDSEITAALPVRDAPLRVRLFPTADGAELAVSGTAEATMAKSALEVRTDGSFALDKGFAVRRVSVPRADVRLRELTVSGHRLRDLYLTGAINGPPDDLEGTADLTAELGATRIETVAVGAAKMNLAADLHWAGQRLDIRQRGDGAASVASLGLGEMA